MFLFKLLLALSSRLIASHAKMKFNVLILLLDNYSFNYEEFVDSIASKRRNIPVINNNVFDVKILATSAPLCYASIIAKNENFDFCLGTDILKPIFNNKFENSKINKKENVLNYLNRENINYIDTFITDHIDDLPLIMVAKRNVIVQPDKYFKNQLIKNSISFEVMG